jgi:DNA-binding MarR family transcriptional regulator
MASRDNASSRRSAPGASRGAGASVDPARGLREDAGQCFCGNLRMAARLVTSYYDAALRPCGIEANQMIMLWAVFTHGSRPGGELARESGMDQSTASRNLGVLQARGLVRTVASTEDRRQRLVVLTRAGRATLLRAYPRWRAAQRQLADGADSLGDVVAVGRMLRRLARALQASDAAGSTADPLD